MSLFGTSGIRGIVNRDITPQLALKVGMAVGSDIDGTVVVGRDTRTSSPSLRDAVVAGIASCGTNVYDIGVAPTPTTGIAIHTTDAAAGITITASHNPPEYNGIKLWDDRGVAFAEEEKRIEDLIRTENFSLQKWDAIGAVTYGHEEALPQHKRAIIDHSTIEEHHTVVVDCGNGAGSVLSPYVFGACGATVTSLNAHPSGQFSRGLEPNRENLETLRATVKHGGADLGIAHDGDADRVGVIDEHGEYVDYDVILALMASYILERGDVFVTTVDASMKIDRYLEEYGISVERTRVGDVAVAKKVNEMGTSFGGEPSGTWIFPEFQMTPDGIYSGVKVLEMHEQWDEIHKLKKEVPYYEILRDKIPCKNAEKETTMKVIEENLNTYDHVNDIDGVRVTLDDAWFLIRPSGTEPYIRITCEAKTKKEAKKVMKECKALF